ncbi:hypothetical protein CR513_34076, partial [Mucuna pruriens]
MSFRSTFTVNVRRNYRKDGFSQKELDNPSHIRPVIWIGMRAKQSKTEHKLSFIFFSNPVYQYQFLRILLGLYWPPSTYYFQNEYAIPIYICACCCFPSLGELRGDVPQCSHNMCCLWINSMLDRSTVLFERIVVSLEFWWYSLSPELEKEPINTRFWNSSTPWK